MQRWNERCSSGKRDRPTDSHRKSQSWRNNNKKKIRFEFIISTSTLGALLFLIKSLCSSFLCFKIVSGALFSFSSFCYLLSISSTLSPHPLGRLLDGWRKKGEKKKKKIVHSLGKFEFALSFNLIECEFILSHFPGARLLLLSDASDAELFLVFKNFLNWTNHLNKKTTVSRVEDIAKSKQKHTVLVFIYIHWQSHYYHFYNCYSRCNYLNLKSVSNNKLVQIKTKSFWSVPLPQRE